MPQASLAGLFTKNSKPVQLTELLSDFQPRTAKEIQQSISISNLASTAKRANQVLKPHGYEIQTQLHPGQRHWFWLMTEVGGCSYAD